MAEMAIGEGGQLLVVIPCDFIHRRALPGEDSNRERLSSTENLTENDLEAAQQLLQLSSHSFESRDGEEEGEDASSSLPNQFLRIDDRTFPRKSGSGAPARRSRRQLTAISAADDADARARRRYKSLSHIYQITRPANPREGEATPRAAKKRQTVAL